MSWLSSGLRGVEKSVSNLIPHAHSADRRQAMQAAKEQIDYYQKAKEDMINARNEAETQKKMERQRINEKEIRSRQRLYRRGGFMEQPAATTKDTLG